MLANQFDRYCDHRIIVMITISDDFSNVWSGIFLHFNKTLTHSIALGNIWRCGPLSIYLQAVILCQCLLWIYPTPLSAKNLIQIFAPKSSFPPSSANSLVIHFLFLLSSLYLLAGLRQFVPDFILTIALTLKWFKGLVNFQVISFFLAFVFFKHLGFREAVVRSILVQFANPKYLILGCTSWLLDGVWLILSLASTWMSPAWKQISISSIGEI